MIEGTFKEELRVLLNRHSIDNEIGLADFRLTDELVAKLYELKAKEADKFRKVESGTGDDILPEFDPVGRTTSSKLARFIFIYPDGRTVADSGKVFSNEEVASAMVNTLLNGDSSLVIPRRPGWALYQQDKDGMYVQVFDTTPKPPPVSDDPVKNIEKEIKQFFKSNVDTKEQWSHPINGSIIHGPDDDQCTSESDPE